MKISDQKVLLKDGEDSDCEPTCLTLIESYLLRVVWSEKAINMSESTLLLTPI